MLGTEVLDCLTHCLCLRLLEITCIYLIWHFIKGKFTATFLALLPRRPTCVSSFSRYSSAASIIFPHIYLRWPTEAACICDTCSSEVWFSFFTAHLQILRIRVYTVKHFFILFYFFASFTSRLLFFPSLVVWNFVVWN